MYDFVNNWSNNPIVVKKIKEYLPSYFLQFKPEDQPIIYKLLENVEYYNEEKLERIMVNIFASCKAASDKYGLEGNYVAGANIAAFEKLAKAMVAQGIV